MIKYSQNYSTYNKYWTCVYIAGKDVKYLYQLFPAITR